MNQRIIFGRHPSEKLPKFLVIYSLQLCILSKGVLTLLVSTSEANLWRTWIIYISWGRIQRGFKPCQSDERAYSRWYVESVLLQIRLGGQHTGCPITHCDKYKLRRC